MRVWFETVVIPANSSRLLYDRKLSEFAFNCHVHPVFELMLTFNSTGMRFVGDHAETYGGRRPGFAWTQSAARLAVLRHPDILLELSRAQDRRPLASGNIAPTDDSRDQTRLARVIGWSNAHYDEPMRLKTLAEIAQLSESQLQRILKRSTWLTVSGYVAQLCNGHACALLVQGNLPVALVGEVVGYPEPAHFTRQFRAAKGVTPSAYRRLFRS